MRFRRHFDTPETLGNFIFGAEANISARAEIHHVNGTKFEPPTLSWAEIRHLTRPLVAVFNFFFLVCNFRAPKHNR